MFNFFEKFAVNIIGSFLSLFLLKCTKDTFITEKQCLLRCPFEINSKKLKIANPNFLPCVAASRFTSLCIVFFSGKFCISKTVFLKVERIEECKSLPWIDVVEKKFFPPNSNFAKITSCVKSHFTLLLT